MAEGSLRIQRNNNNIQSQSSLNQQQHCDAASDDELESSPQQHSHILEQRVRSDRMPMTKPEEDRRRRTIIVEKKNGSYGFTLQSYGIHYKKEQEIEMITYVDYVEYDGPAYKSGMREGDVILSINGSDMEKVDHKTLVAFIKECDTRMRMVVLFEDCVRKVELHMRYIQLQNVLQSKMAELEQVCVRERELLEGKWKTHSLPARKSKIHQPVHTNINIITPSSTSTSFDHSDNSLAATAAAAVTPTTTDSDTTLPYTRPTLSTEDINLTRFNSKTHYQHLHQHPNNVNVIPPPAQFMLTYQYLDPRYRYILRPTVSISAGNSSAAGSNNNNNTNCSGADYLLTVGGQASASSSQPLVSRSKSDHQYFIDHQHHSSSSTTTITSTTTQSTSIDVNTNTTQNDNKYRNRHHHHHHHHQHQHNHPQQPNELQDSLLHQYETQKPPPPPPATLQQEQSQADKVDMKNSSKSNRHYHGHSCNPCIGHSKKNETNNNNNNNNNNGDNISLDAYDLASPCCDPHCIPNRRRSRHHKEHHHKHKHKECSKEQTQQQSQSQSQPQPQQQRSRSHSHANPSGKHSISNIQTTGYHVPAHNNEKHNHRQRVYDINTGLKSHCSLHSCTSSEFGGGGGGCSSSSIGGCGAETSVASYNTSLSTDTLYWDPRSETHSIPSRQHSMKSSKNSYHQQLSQPIHSQHPQYQSVSTQQQQQHQHQPHFAARYHLHSTQIQPLISTETPAIQYKPHKPKSWDNLATKSYGGYGFGYGYLDTINYSKNTHHQQQAQQQQQPQQQQSLQHFQQQLPLNALKIQQQQHHQHQHHQHQHQLQSTNPLMLISTSNQRHSIPRKNPYGRYSTFSDVENYAPPPSQFVQEITTTTTITKSTENLLGTYNLSDLSLHSCDCFQPSSTSFSKFISTPNSSTTTNTNSSPLTVDASAIVAATSSTTTNESLQNELNVGVDTISSNNTPTTTTNTTGIITTITPSQTLKRAAGHDHCRGYYSHLSNTSSTLPNHLISNNNNNNNNCNNNCNNTTTVLSTATLGRGVATVSEVTRL